MELRESIELLLLHSQTVTQTELKWQNAFNVGAGDPRSVTVLSLRVTVLMLGLDPSLPSIVSPLL